MHTAIAELEHQIRPTSPISGPGTPKSMCGSRRHPVPDPGFPGMIRRQGGGARETFTVRKISYGVGVERTFPVHSPSLDKIELVTRGRVRRAKLYYLRELRGKAARIKERR